MSENKRQIAFTGTIEYRNLLQREALDRGVKVQQLIEQAIESYLRSSSHTPHAPAPERALSTHQPWIDKLLTILDHGTDLDKIGIQSNLDAFCAKITLENPPRRKRAAGE